VASTNNKIRIPSRKMIEQHADAASGLGARGLVVHGGHVGDGDDIAVGVDNWRKTFARAEFPVRVLVENTAGGENACARTLDRIAMLWDAIGGGEVRGCPGTSPTRGGRGGLGRRRGRHTRSARGRGKG